jgi:hypothetical protein
LNCNPRQGNGNPAVQFVNQNRVTKISLGNSNTIRKTKDINLFYFNQLSDSSSNTPGRLETWSGDDIRNAIRFNEHLLPDRLVAGEITALYGEPKVGKTFVAISCGLMAAIGGKFWNEDFPMDGCKVIYVAAERRGQAAIRIDAACIASGLGSIPKNFTLVERQAGLRLNDVVAMAELRDLVREINPDVMIFDTYVRMVDNDEDKSKDTDSNIEILTSLLRESSRPCAGILVHHAGKDISKKMRGSSALLAAVTSVWKVTRLKSTGVITLAMDDANSFAAPDPCYFTIRTCSIPSLVGSDKPQKVGVAFPVGEPLKSTNRDLRVCAIMRQDMERWWGIEDLMGALQAEGETLSHSTVERVVKSLWNSGIIQRRPDSKAQVYQLSRSSDLNHGY